MEHTYINKMNDIFQNIINKKTNAYIIYEDEKVIAFLDILPKSTGHCLVISKKFSHNFFDIKDDDLQNLIIKAKTIAIHVTKILQVNSFQLLINNGKNSGQIVPRTHIHIIPSQTKLEIHKLHELQKILSF